MGYNQCVARLYRAENGWSVEIEEPGKKTKEQPYPPTQTRTLLATDWAGVIKILNAEVKGKSAEDDYAESFATADKS